MMIYTVQAKPVRNRKQESTQNNNVTVIGLLLPFESLLHLSHFENKLQLGLSVFLVQLSSNQAS
eukprot:4185346-Amphidinium_carterae.1